MEKEIKLNNYLNSKYYQTISQSNNADIATINNIETFKSNFKELSKHYELINPDEIYEFIKLNNNLLNELYLVLPLLNKYFPSKRFQLKFVPDYEFEELNQLVVYICSDEDNFEDDWKIINELDAKLRSNIAVDVMVNDDIF